MKNTKIMVTLLSLILISIFLFSACNPRNSNLKYPSMDMKDEIICTFENANLYFYANYAWTSHAVFDLVCQEELKPEDLSLSADIKTPMSFAFSKIPEPERPISEEGEKEEKAPIPLPYYVFQSYNNFDFAKYYELYCKALKSGGIPIDGKPAKTTPESIAYDEYGDIFYKDYIKITKDILPHLFTYQCTLAFDMNRIPLDKNEVINEVILTIKGKEYKIPLNIVLDYITPKDFIEEGIEMIYPSSSGSSICPNIDGFMTPPGGNFSTLSDIKITGVRLLNNEMSIEKTTFTVSDENGMSINQTFKPGASLEIAANSIVIPRVTIRDPSFVNKLIYSTSATVIIDYICEGKNFSTYYEATMRTRANSFELFASKIDGIDFFPYYYEYLFNFQD
ncbi:MAG: hypothetical protein RRY79_01520 [Clostridia bacterium]